MKLDPMKLGARYNPNDTVDFFYPALAGNDPVVVLTIHADMVHDMILDIRNRYAELNPADIDQILSSEKITSMLKNALAKY